MNDNTLKLGYYFVRLKDGRVVIAWWRSDVKLWAFCESKDVVEVLAPCDYEKLHRLKEENKQLRALLKECKPYIQKEMETIKSAGFCDCDWAWRISDLLIRINAALGESEE